MSSGTRVVLGFVLFAALVFAILEIYGRASLDRRVSDSPVTTAREAVQADNTVVGLIGGIATFEPIAVEARGEEGAPTAQLEARVLGVRDSGRLVAELLLEDGRWVIRRATFTLSDGTTIPVAGSAGR